MLGDILKVDDSVYVQDSLGLFGRDVFFHIFLETVSELLDMFPFQGESGSIGMSAKVDQQVAATLDGRVNVKSCHTAGRAGSHVTFFCEYHGGAEIDFGQS